MKLPTEGGSGGRRGMEHWAETDEIKKAARRRRRQADESSANEGLDGIDRHCGGDPSLG